jgi:hypothetical protein
MKLIIDIPEDEYNAIKNTAFVEDEKTIFRQNANDRKCTMGLFHIIDEVKNGTPIPDNATVCDIEQIRDAIEREADYQDANVNADVAKGMYMAIGIIDRHTAESEEI